MYAHRCLVLIISTFLWSGVVVSGDEPAPARGTIVGVVRFTGKIPPPRKVLTGDGAVLEHSDLVVDVKTKGLLSVGVLLEDAPAQPPGKNAKMVLVDQREMQFLPRIVAVQLGQTVRFENNDLCNHSVMGVSTVAENQFNLFAGPNQPVDRTFALQKNPVQIGCSLHSWMRAWVLVAAHPWVTVTDRAGRFRLENVPVGRWSLRLQHPDTGKQERRRVEVTAGQAVRIEVDWQRVD